MDVYYVCMYVCTHEIDFFDWISLGLSLKESPNNLLSSVINTQATQQTLSVIMAIKSFATAPYTPHSFAMHIHR